MSQKQPRKTGTKSRSASQYGKAKRKSNRLMGPERPKGSLNPGMNESLSYPVSRPTIQGRVRRSIAPTVTRLRNGDCRISHREYISEMGGSAAAFTTTKYSVNPGLPTSFPWLSSVANQYESYRFVKLAFFFETEVSTATAGSIMLGVDYDASDPAPVSKVQLMDYRGSVRCPTWSECALHCLPEDLHKQKSHFVRSGALSANQDVKLYDVANFWPSAIGQAVTSSVGELYVEYDVELYTPQLNPDAQLVSGKFSGTSNASPFATVSGSVPATVVSTGTTTSVSTFTFSGNYQGLASLNLIGTGITSITLAGTGTETKLVELIDAAATNSITVFTLNEAYDTLGAQTLTITIANTTLTTVILRIGEYLTTLG